LKAQLTAGVGRHAGENDGQKDGPTRNQAQVKNTARYIDAVAVRHIPGGLGWTEVSDDDERNRHGASSDARSWRVRRRRCVPHGARGLRRGRKQGRPPRLRRVGAG